MLGGGGTFMRASQNQVKTACCLTQTTLLQKRLFVIVKTYDESFNSKRFSSFSSNWYVKNQAGSNTPPPPPPNATKVIFTAKWQGFTLRL